MFPPTFYAQTVGTFAMLGLGIAGLAAAARAQGAPPRHRLGWRITGQVFLAAGIGRIVQNTGGGAALLGGEGSAAWDSYLVWAPGMNYGRQLSLCILGALFLLLAVRPADAAPLRSGRVWLLLLLGYAVGMAAGLVEGPMGARHFRNFAMLNTAPLLVLLAGLAVAAVADAIDRLLALALAVNTAVLPLYSLWLSWNMQSGGRPAPTPFQYQSYYALFSLMALAIGVRRWHLARRGVPVPGLFSPLLRGARA